MIDWRRLSIRTLTVWLAATFGAFALGCYLIYAWHSEISRSVVATHAVLAIVGVSALTWPLFAVQLLSALIRRALRRGL